MAGSRGGRRRTGRKPTGDGSSAANAAKPAGIRKNRKTATALSMTNAAGNQAAAPTTTAPRRTRSDRRSLTSDVANHETLFDLVDPESILRQARAPRRAARRRVNRPPPATPAPVAPPAQPQANVQDEATDAAHNAPAREDQPAGNEPVATNQTAESQRVTRKSSSAQRREKSDQAAKEAEARKRDKAAKQQAADEQAKKDSDAREAAAREKVALEEAKREEVAREKAAQEKAVQEEKAAREKAARDEAVRQEEARVKASEEKAARKRSAEVKAANVKAAAEKVAQEKAEQAAKEKAAWEEASRAAEQATNTPTAQGHSAEAKVAEEHPTMNHTSSRPAKEAEEKRDRDESEASEAAAAELEKRDAAGYKKPRTKRSIPDAQTELDKANKKAKVDEKTSCKAFETGLKLAKVKAESDGRLKLDKPEWDPVKFGEHLTLDSVFMALASVTEAINDSSVQKGQPKLFSLFHPRSLVDYSPLEHPVALKLQEALVPIRRSPRHLALVVLVPTQQQGTSGEDDYFDMHYYDSNARLRDAFGTTVAESNVKESILKSGWAGTGMQRKTDALVEAQYWEVCDQPAGQEWTSGVHAILNGWVCALALMHNKNALISKDGFYEKAVELINFVVRGAVSPQTIIDFFDCYEYVLPHPETPSTNVLKRRSWKDTRNFWTYARLDTHIMKLLGRPARLDIEAAMTPRHSVSASAPASARGTAPKGVEGPVRLSGVSPSTPNSATTPSSAVAAALRGVEGPAGLPNLEPEQTDVESNIEAATYDTTQLGDTGMGPEVVDDVLEEEDEDVVAEEDDEFESCNGFRRRAATPVIDPEQAARTAAQAQARLQERQKQEYQAAIRDTSADPEDDSLFDDQDLDVGEFFGDNGVSNPDGATTQGQHATQPDLPPPVADDGEEDLYTASPPRRTTQPPTASGLHLPGPPPPTPHDPAPNTTIKEFTVPSLEFLNEHQRAAALAAARAARQTNPGFRVPSISSASATSSDPPAQPNSGVRTPSLSSSSANPAGRPNQTNPGFHVPSISSASATSSAPEDSSRKPSAARPFVVTNPHGTFTVPDISSASTDSPDAARPTGAQQANAEAFSEAWAAGWGGRGQDAGLEAAMAEYGSGFRAINESTAAGQTPPGPYGFDDEYEEEPSQVFRSGQSAIEGDDGDEGEEGEGEEDGEYGRGDDEDDEEGPDQEPSHDFDPNQGTFDEDGDDVFREDYIDYDD